MPISPECQPGCMSFDGGEVKHRLDCVHYPESLTKVWHDREAELSAEITRLRACLENTRDEICEGPVGDVLWHDAGCTTVDNITLALRDGWTYDGWTDAKSTQA